MPIGDPEDISLRALRILGSVDCIIAERPSAARPFLARYGISTPVKPYSRGRNNSGQLTALVARLLSGHSAALVCEAGTPLIADAGIVLVRAALDADITVRPVPGASAVLAALVIAGATIARFAFDGFAPRSRAERESYFASLCGEARSVVLYESRAFLNNTLLRLSTALGPHRQVLVARNITRPTETLFYGHLADAQLAHREPCGGEYTIVVYGSEILSPQGA